MHRSLIADCRKTVLPIILIALLTGCTHLHVETPSGAFLDYTRVLSAAHLAIVPAPDGEAGVTISGNPDADAFGAIAEGLIHGVKVAK